MPHFITTPEPVHFNNISLTQLFFNKHKTAPIDFFILRLDKIHPEISGNKWYKLRFYMDDALQQNKQTIATYGGAWSNHILATAATCKLKGLKSIGIIRGEKPAKFSDTLEKAMAYGMELIFISREEYRLKKLPPELINIPGVYIIPEGGYGEKGAWGAATIAEQYTKDNFTHICCAVGTGTTMAGLVMAASAQPTVTGISVLKNNRSIENEIRSLLPGSDRSKKFSVIHDYHFGGYAKNDPSLIDFMNTCYKETNVPLDFVYTGKLLFAVYDLAAKGFFPHGSRILIIHSGGLQGNNSLPKGTLIF